MLFLVDNLVVKVLRNYYSNNMNEYVVNSTSQTLPN